MYHYQYVTKSETRPLKRELIKMLNLVQDKVRDKFTFQYYFIGSESRNMVTWDPRGNVGFDLDVDLWVNEKTGKFTAAEIRQALMNGISQAAKKSGYDFCGDDTRSFRIKVKDRRNAKILHSCDFAIIRKDKNGKMQYIHFDKAKHCYLWENQPEDYEKLPQMSAFCQEKRLWNQVRKRYLEKKNNNSDPNKKSRALFAETVHEISRQNGYR